MMALLAIQRGLCILSNFILYVCKKDFHFFCYNSSQRILFVKIVGILKFVNFKNFKILKICILKLWYRV